jgi:hypothetical protein
MEIRVGFEISYFANNPTPMVLMLSIHPSRLGDIVGLENISNDRGVPITYYRDIFGNVCGRLVAPAGGITFNGDTLVRDSGQLDLVVPTAQQIPIDQLPDECLLHNHVTFGYQHAHYMKSAHDVYEQKTGVCRDFAHLALTFCRCMNIPARYCTGYMGDIGIPYDPAPMDFSGWFEVYLSGHWYTFDARHNKQRIGRILMGTGRDAADVALTTSFGRMDLVKFKVISDEIKPAA